jgi:hypothetical protein
MPLLRRGRHRRAADFTVESGPLRAERFGSLWEVMERRGGYRLTLLGKRDREELRKLLDLMDNAEAGKPVLVLDERRRA